MNVPQEVAPNLYLINVPLPENPLKNLNAYLIRGEKGGRSLLVDTGFRRKECREALLDQMRELKVDLPNTDIFLTHLHSDHSGLAAELAVPGVRVYISEKDRVWMPGKDCIENWDNSDHFLLQNGFSSEELEKIRTTNPARGYRPIPFDDYIGVEPGTMFSYGGYHFEAIDTPGHTIGHMCLYDAASKIMLLGDHVLFDITPNIATTFGNRNSLGMYLDSLKRIRQYDVALPLPAHRTVHTDMVARVDQILAHHEARCNEVLQILADSPGLNAYDITARMTWKIRCRNWEEFPSAQRWFAVGEAISHLIYLDSIGKVRRVLDGDMYLHFLAD